MNTEKLMDELSGLQKYLETSQAETDFLCGTEKQRLDILEILEKLMDIGDLADEVATRLIFRGRMPFNHTTH